jgi:hypothetical protein
MFQGGKSSSCQRILLIMSLSIRRDFNPFKNMPAPPVEEGIAKRIPVMVRGHRAGNFEWEHFYGYIVTHLDIRDYCVLNSLQLIEVLPGTRPALSNERTELF